MLQGFPSCSRGKTSALSQVLKTLVGCRARCQCRGSTARFVANHRGQHCEHKLRQHQHRPHSLHLLRRLPLVSTKGHAGRAPRQAACESRAQRLDVSSLFKLAGLGFKLYLMISQGEMKLRKTTFPASPDRLLSIFEASHFLWIQSQRGNRSPAGIPIILPTILACIFRLFQSSGLHM